MQTEKYDYWAELADEQRQEGRLDGLDDALLIVLAARGIVISNAARDRIGDCRDTEQLDLWLRRAATIDHIDQLFD